MACPASGLDLAVARRGAATGIVGVRSRGIAVVERAVETPI